MARNSKEAKVLIATLLITTGLAFGGLYFFLKNSSSNNISSSQSSSNPNNSQGESTNNRISTGEKILVTADSNPDKEAGVKAIAASDWQTAKTKLEAALKVNRNDPEAVIYLNNAQIGTNPALKIAVSVPITSNLNVSKEILRGVAQAQAEVNQAGGINGKLLKVAIASDDNKPEVVKSIAESFVKDSSILAVVGHNSSDASLAGGAIYQPAGLVMISPTATAKNLTGFGNYIFRTTLSNTFQANALARYALKVERRNNFGVCISSSAKAAVSAKEEFTLAVYSGGGKVSRVNCDFSDPNFNPAKLVADLASDGVNAIFMVPDVDMIERAVSIAKESKGRFLLLSDATLYTFKTLDLGRADVKGMILTTTWLPQANPNHPFLSNAQKLWGGNVNWRSATSYDAVIAIVGGLKQSDTRSGLQQALSNPSFSIQGATGEIQFQPSGDRNSPPVFMRIDSGSNSGTGYDFVLLPNPSGL